MKLEQYLVKKMARRVTVVESAILLVVLVLAASPQSYSQQTKPSQRHQPSDIKETPKAKPSAEEGGQVLEVVATGIATDADGAVQAAFSQAIEQAVGVLVDAETIVKNDEIVRDQVLTFSRGFIQKFEVIWQGKKDGLHMARIRAKVSVNKLTEKLQAGKITTREVPGELLARQFKFDFKNEKEAAEMLAKKLEDFDMTKLTKVELIGKPEVSREGSMAYMNIKAKVSPDMEHWATFSKDLRAFLVQTSLAKANITEKNGWITYPGGYDALERDVKTNSPSEHLTGLYIGPGNKPEVNCWQVFKLPAIMQSRISESAENTYSLKFVLLDEKGNTVLESVEPLGGGNFSSVTSWRRVRDMYSMGYPGTIWYVGPVWFKAPPSLASSPVSTVNHKISISVEDLQKVARVKVLMEEEKKDK